MSGIKDTLEKRRENITMPKRKRKGVKIYMESKLLLGDCKDKLKELDDNSVDLMATDPPYGLSFMGKEWDSFNEVENIERDMPNTVYAKKGFKKLPRNKPVAMREFFVPIWKECLRVLKPGGFAFVMAAPKQDVLRKQIETLEEAGFRTDFTSIYWTYATGFPKAMNIGKAVDKKLGKERVVVGKKNCGYQVSISKKRKEEGYRPNLTNAKSEVDITVPASDEAKDLDGSYAGFQPKPAVEVVIVAMKPLDKKGYLEQAMDNGKGITWFDDCRIPFQMGDTPQGGYGDMGVGIGKPGETQEYRSKDYKQYNKDNVGSQENFDTDPDGLSRGKQPSRKKTRVSAFGDSNQSETGDGRNLWGKKSTKIVEVDLPPTRKTTKRKPREDGTVFKTSGFKSEENDTAEADPMGRFPANLLVSDDVLNDGKITKGWPGQHHNKFNPYGGTSLHSSATERDGFHMGFPDEGSFSRYYSLDEWWKRYFKDLPEEVQKTFPFIIVPKAPKREKNMGLKKNKFSKAIGHNRFDQCATCGGYILQNQDRPSACKCETPVRKDNTIKGNFHPTVKPVELMSYLITLGSRDDDLVLDPFVGSGTTCIAAKLLNRKYIGMEREDDYVIIARERVKAHRPKKVQHDFF